MLSLSRKKTGRRTNEAKIRNEGRERRGNERKSLPCLFVCLLMWLLACFNASKQCRLIHVSSLAAARAFSSADMSSGENVVVPLISQSLEWALSSPPPLHQFTEPPLVVETDHLDLNPGKEVEEILAVQGHEVTDIVGKEKWILNDPSLYEGLIPQNADWTEFVDEKTGEWVYLDEYGNRVESP